MRLAYAIRSFAKQADAIAENHVFDVPCDKLLNDFRHTYDRILPEPLSRSDVVELTGGMTRPACKPADIGAWVCRSAMQLDVVDVTAKLVHKSNGKREFPIIRQLEFSLGTSARQVDLDDAIGKDRGISKEVLESSLLDILAIDDRTIFLVAAEMAGGVSDFVGRLPPSLPLFQQHVFTNKRGLKRKAESLYAAKAIVGAAFPERAIELRYLLVHPSLPHFECFVLGSLPSEIDLANCEMFCCSSDDSFPAESYCRLGTLFPDERFAGTPPCRNGRTLQTLATMAHVQLRSDGLRSFDDGDIAQLLKDIYGRIIPRDKLRHDIQYHLERSGALEPCEGGTCVTPGGIARYFYCLRKFTSVNRYTADDVIDFCVAQRERAQQSA